MGTVKEGVKMMENLGKKQWVIPDGFLSSTKNGPYESHESVCVLNLSEQKANIEMTIFFEDRDPIGGFCVECLSKRGKHIRLDKLINKDGLVIPKDVPYALLVQSEVPIICQYSRMDVSQPEMTLMTTIPY